MKIALAALLSLAFTSIPIGAFVYWYTPTPQFVESASETLRRPVVEHMVAPKTRQDISLKTISELRDVPMTEQERSAAIAHTRESATVVAWIPVVYSISSGVILGWCITLVIAFTLVKRALRDASCKGTFTREQTLIVRGLATLITVNGIVLLLIAPSFVHVLDSLVMWNLGMIAVLAYYSLSLRYTRTFQSYLVTASGEYDAYLDPTIAKDELDRMLPDRFWTTTPPNQ